MQVQLGDQIQRDMAIMFSDIRFFSILNKIKDPLCIKSEVINKKLDKILKRKREPCEFAVQRIVF